MAFNDIVVEFEQLRSDCACHLHNSQHNSYLLMVEVSPELVDSKSTHRSVNGLLIAGNVSILLLTRSLPLYYKTIAVIALTNNNTRENKTKLDRSEQHAANFIAILYPAYANKMSRVICSTDNSSLIEVRIHFKLVERLKDTCGHLYSEKCQDQPNALRCDFYWQPSHI